MQLQVLENEHFSCQGCGDCCRHWHVQLLEDEADRIASLDWGQDDPLHNRNVLLTHGKSTYLKHEDNGSCVMLDANTKRCRIHERFGERAKPIGCQLFPFQLSRTFNNLVTTTTRFTCPTVQRNEGDLHETHRKALQKISQNLTLDHGFDEQDLCLLEPDQAKQIVDFTLILMGAFERPEAKMIFLHALCMWLAMQPADSIDREKLSETFIPLKNHVEATLAATHAKPKHIHRLAFFTVLACHLRRDEDVLDGRISRLSRFWATGRVCVGKGNLAKLGHDHPYVSLRKAGLFTKRTIQAEPEIFEIFFRMIRQKLASYQFMGNANFGLNFLEGLLDLCLLYPLVTASAVCHAAAKGHNCIEASDVAYATAAIERGYGRNALLNNPAVLKLKMMLVQPSAFESLVLNS